ncbi:MarR family winged helix-turn-helix transcriptional regulator [Gulosibacter faecalis]|jgi:DNA-binding MarR family transcriptional regulator|uniref:MarR family winged helix-turn-helix transcriptional regulator n=1 Tax=Gulosibacter faecalis TaxID=272240 RepID=A0ABW5UX33_9MICO|nr:MarR family transcriptional regulator [Gulosibacter faecalis]
MHPHETDAVDTIVDEWTRARPDLDFSPLSVFSRVKRISRQLEVVRKRAFAEVGLELSEFDVLSALRRSGEPYALTPKQLLASNLVSSGTMTYRIDRLVESGLVVREDDPADGRSVLVRMTPEGRQRVDAAIKGLLEREVVLLADVTDEEFRVLERGLRELSLAMTDDAN